jgi:arabinogalactan oligomer/maltooligosaccharide transport system permease protein
MTKELPADGSAQKKIKITALGFMGLSHILYLKEWAKGIIFSLIEVVFLILCPFFVKKLAGLISLGDPQPNIPIRQRNNSIFMLIDGILILAVIILFIITYILSVKSAEKSYHRYCIRKYFPSQKNSLSATINNAFPVLGLSPMFVLLLVFVVVPLVFSVAVAFTNYSAPAHIPPNKTVDWVGFGNFKVLLTGKTNWSVGFARIAVWTVVWAFCATFTCYFGGLLIAVMLNGYKYKVASVFRLFFILPYAVPSVITMITWRNLLNGAFGTVNRTLIALGLITQPIPWLSSTRLAQLMCILINLWAGFGYFMMLAMGTMSAISADLFEAARIDGANSRQLFHRITVPIVLYQTMPQIIMSFTFNLNNFGIIFFLTGGTPATTDSTTTMAGGTDILITWIYKLTITLLKYNYASVIAVLIFVVMAPFAIISFRRTKSYKEGEI